MKKRNAVYYSIHVLSSPSNRFFSDVSQRRLMRPLIPSQTSSVFKRHSIQFTRSF